METEARTVYVIHHAYAHGRATLVVTPVDAEIRTMGGGRERAFARHPTGPWAWELADGQWFDDEAEAQRVLAIRARNLRIKRI